MSTSQPPKRTAAPAPAAPAKPANAHVKPEKPTKKITTITSSNRITSLDQFRGYTVAGMFLVNFLGGYWACPPILQHHNTYCSYADTIMPHFLFAVGFAFRLTFGRHLHDEGAFRAYMRVVRRLLGLVLVAIVVYSAGRPADTWNELRSMGLWEILQGPLKRDWFQTLMHIAATSLWILPVIRAGALIRIFYMILSAGLHVYLSYAFYFTWVHADPKGIDGGPLGFLTWSIPALFGTLACDAIVRKEGSPRWLLLSVTSILLMGFGWGLSCFSRLYDVPAEERETITRGDEFAASPVLFSISDLRSRDPKTLIMEPPFVPPPGSRAEQEQQRFMESQDKLRYLFVNEPSPPPPEESYKYRRWNYWMMSQRAGSISYLIFAAGLSGLVYVLFYLICDRVGLRLGIFRTFGTNALAGYVLHGMVDSAVSPFVPRDVPGWYMWAGFAVFFAITYLFVRTLEKNGIFIKL